MSSEKTAEKLIATASEEFQRFGYNGTDVNRIARRSAMAPTTFYRCFKDKLDIFLAVHQRWAAREALLMRALITSPAPDAELVETCVAHYRDHLRFRRGLRQLAHEEPRARQARARARLEMIAAICGWRGEPVASDERMALDLIRFEWLADLLAEGELADMGLDEARARDELSHILARFRAEWPAQVDMPQDGARPASLIQTLSLVLG